MKVTATSKIGNIKANYVVNVEVQEDVDRSEDLVGERLATYIRISIKLGKGGWFSTNSSDLAPAVMNEVRRYLMITDESYRLKVAPAATKPGRR